MNHQRYSISHKIQDKKIQLVVSKQNSEGILLRNWEGNQYLIVIFLKSKILIIKRKLIRCLIKLIMQLEQASRLRVSNKMKNSE